MLATSMFVGESLFFLSFSLSSVAVVYFWSYGWLVICFSLYEGTKVCLHSPVQKQNKNKTTPQQLLSTVILLLLFDERIVVWKSIISSITYCKCLKLS